MSGCRLAIIADDLSGALDTAAPFAARGADTRVVISLEVLAATLETWQGQWPDVIAVNTESRHLLADQAARRVFEAVQLLKRAHPQQWFKKVDSTLRGQVIAECTALREALGIALLLAPAVPAQGRIVRDAQVWVEGCLLADTAYQQDARSTPIIGPIDHAFAASGLPLHRYYPGLEEAIPGEDCIVDAASDEALSMLYEQLLASGENRAMVGAAGLAAAIAHRCFGAADAHFRSLENVSAVVYAVGSRSLRAGEQLSQLRQQFPHLTVINACGEPMAAPYSNHAFSACAVVPGSDGTVHTASEVAAKMAGQVALMTSSWQKDAEQLLFLTGGDIAMAVLTQLSVSCITVETEWSPGVALGYVDSDPRRRVITKAGGFGDPQLLVRLQQQFKAALETR